MKKTPVHFLLLTAGTFFMAACGSGLAPLREDALPATVITEPTAHDTDDPAIWINQKDPSKSLIVGTDKNSEGGLYVYDLEGKIVHKTPTLKRPNNVDIAYGLVVGKDTVDIAVTTEVETDKIRIYQLPDLKPLDGGGIPVFEGESEKHPMGISLYTRPADSAIFAIVGRKSGPSGSYLWQYRLRGNANGQVTASVVRKFGAYSGKKEIEAIAVDNELGYVYYSDEKAGIHKYVADPDAGNKMELAFFGQDDMKSDHEGIAIYKSSDSTGYLLVSNQQANTFVVYPREGANGDPNAHKKIAEIPTSTIECDGADASSFNFGGKFPKGFLVAMSNGRTFHLYDWRIIQQWIDAGKM